MADPFGSNKRDRQTGRRALTKLAIPGVGGPLGSILFPEEGPEPIPSLRGFKPTKAQFTEGFNATSPEILKELGGLDVSGINADPRALEALREEGLRTGPSRFAGLQATSEQERAEQAQGALAQQAAAQAAQAQSNLAARGGISSGARERLAAEGIGSFLEGSQRQSFETGQAQRDILAQDEQRRLGVLGQLPGLELAAIAPEFQKAEFGLSKVQTGGQARQFDQQQRAAEAERKTRFSLLQAQAENEAKARNQQIQAAQLQARATQQAGGGGKGGLFG